MTWIGITIIALLILLIALKLGEIGTLGKILLIIERIEFNTMIKAPETTDEELNELMGIDKNDLKAKNDDTISPLTTEHIEL
jgi:hypothetical protein